MVGEGAPIMVSVVGGLRLWEVQEVVSEHAHAING